MNLSLLPRLPYWLLLIRGICVVAPLQAQSISPEVFETEAGELRLYPVLHATFVMEWNDITIYVDPYGGAERFADFTVPDLVLITHAHGDHFNPETLNGLNLEATELIAPQSVVDQLDELKFGTVTALANEETVERMDVQITAVPMYNLPDDETSRHKPGWGNGYVLTLGGKRLYVSGDTEDIREMRTLADIDIAFVCMNLPYTMTVEQAADAVIEFAPKIVYPFHYRGGGGKFSDVEAFQTLVKAENEAIEVRLRNWYPE